MSKKYLLIAGIAIVLIATAQRTEAVDWTTEVVDSYGDVGKHTSLAIDKDGWPHISYYDDSNNDLKYAYKDGSGWHRTTVDATLYYSNAWTSIALDSLGYPHISYYDDGNDDLKYAYKDNSGWHIETVRSYGNVGYGSEIALDSDGYPHIVYYGDYDGHRRLIYAYKDLLGWHTYTVVWDITSQNWSGTPFSIALDIYDYPHISYFDDNNLKYIYKMGTSWHHETIETGYGEGSGTSIALDQNGYPHIAYNRESGEDLKYAYKDETGWHLYTVDSDDNVGNCPSIALDYQSYPHISYFDDSNDDLKYAYKDNAGWHNQTVQSYNNVGYWSSIALNYSGEPHISYYDDTNDDLKFARPQSYSPRTFTILLPDNGSWNHSKPTFIWEPCSYQGNSLSHYELWVDEVWNKDVPKTQPFSEPASSLSSGWHTWKVKAVKLDGNSIWSNESWSVRIDATPPITFDLILPADGTWTTDRTPTLTWQGSTDAGSGLKEYRLYIDGSLARAGISPDSISTTPLWNLSSGDHTWNIAAVDNAGNITQSNQTWTVRIDYTGPNSFSLLSPNSYSYTSVDTPTFRWKSTTDAGVGMSQYQLWIDYSMIDSILADVELDTMTFTIDTSMALNHGSHRWYIKALDKLGNFQNSTTWYLYVDLKPPNPFSLQTPVDSAIVSLPTPNFNWSSTSDYTPTASGLAKYQLWIDSSLNVDNVTGTSTAPGAPLAEGYHSWFVKAYDNVGNIRNSNETWNVILEWNPPTAFDLASPANWDTVLMSSPVLSWRPSSDAGSGVQKYQLWINNNIDRDNILPTDTSSTPANPLENGQYNWFVKAVDFAGNITSSSSIWTFVVNVDYIPPISQITYPVDGDTIGGISVEIQGTSTDGTGIGVDSVFVSTDNGQSWYLVQKVNENYDSWTYLWENFNYGDYIIRSRAKDIGGNREIPGDSVRVHVKNSLPFIVNPLPDLTLNEDMPDTSLFSLDSVFSDLNVGDTLLYTYGVIPSDAGININIDESTHIPTVKLEENWNGNAQAIFIAMDNQLDVVRDTVLITVLPINDAPVISDIPDTSFVEDDSLSFDLDNYVVDIDDPNSSLIWDVSLIDGDGLLLSAGQNNDVLTKFYRVANRYVSKKSTNIKSKGTSFNNKFTGSSITTTADSQTSGAASEEGSIKVVIDQVTHNVTFTATDDYFVKDVPFFFTVNDTSGASDTDTMCITISPENDAPIFSAIPYTSFDEDSQLIIALSYFYTYVDDPDNADSTLSFVFNGTDYINASASGDSILLYAQSNWNGVDTIEVIVRDGSLSDTTSWRIIVNPVNDAPVITSADSVSATEDIHFKYIATASDIEDSSITFSFDDLPFWLFSNADSVYGIPPEGMKDTSFIVIASDGELNDTLTVILTVISVNDPPTISAIPDTSFNEDGQLKFATSYFYDFVYDPDNADSSLTWTFSDTDYINASINEDSVILSSEKDWFGKDTLSVKVSDGEFFDEASFVITVHPVNDPPYFTELMPDSIAFDSNVSDTLLLTELASDIDNPDTSLVWSYIHSSFVLCHINDTTKTAIFWVEENLSGQDTVVLSISDGEFTVYDSLIVIVNPVTGIEYLMSQIPKEYSLKQNYPNPFNPTTTIIYGLPKISHVNIRIYDLLGREVTTLVNNKQEAKHYKVIWDAKDRSGNAVPSGMYLYRIVAKSGNKTFVKTKKLLLMR